MSKMKNKIKIKTLKRTDSHVKIFDVVINGTRKSQVLSKIWLQRKEMLHVATVNPEYVMEARRNVEFRQVLSQCLTVADGYGVVWAMRILGNRGIEQEGKGVERISGVELVNEILQHARGVGEKVFLLGGREGVAEKAAAEMSKKYPGLQIYSYSGARTVKVEKDEEAKMTIAKINGICPDYLLVAYGSPSQDLWIEKNRPYLRARVAMGVGGTLDEWAGLVVNCPTWLDKIGLKWAWRVAHEPWRWRRIFGVFQFGWLVLYHKLID
ncbi:hypothetical protein COT87_01455 [Candidatus Collierbacteria bacterium CG10_big_fil_rev_8_21_14_0_10_44_9]|uniref:Acetylglucosaminyldiphospho-UDP acetyl-beta-D-mannosaminyltransferase n=1 Tax=Candidatus Collierbacteria bacterium CG10_big_fil_rev_8_21_14_0_10_44_9 TaxID=1974535 RepID=A0A2H0VIY6_9BACT|nr:MAG: hypothetical protein COT87_01455 [Candidatus Collierbacteria bacterium CG10_big_fil_rev_8_21_14_0_10_44_9]